MRVNEDVVRLKWEKRGGGKGTEMWTNNRLCKLEESKSKETAKRGPCWEPTASAEGGGIQGGEKTLP